MDSYWSYEGGGDDMDTATGAGGYSPSAGAAPSSSTSGGNGFGRPLGKTASEDLRTSYGVSSNNQSEYAGFNPMENARLSPSAFDPTNFSGQFILPRFASGGQNDPFGMGVSVMDTTNAPRGEISPMPYDYGFQSQTANQSVLQQQYNSRNGGGGLTPTSSFFSQNFDSGATAQQSQQQHQNDGTSRQQQSQFSIANPQPPSTSASAVASTSAVPYAPPSVPAPLPPASTSGPPSSTYETESPVYAPYGSSVISVNQNSNTAYKLPPLAMHLPPAQPASSPFNPTALGLPAPPPAGQSNNFAGLYSTSGFDLLGVLARVAARPNPQIQIGPVDSSCAFAVVDARRWDQPLVFASDTFVKMTGYSNEEIVGRNCRFLQSPGGQTAQGAPRKYTDGNAAWHMRTHIQAGKESQSSLINYTKAGRPFINLVTIIPICWDTEEIAYFVGFQVDLVDQPNAILDRMRDGSYIVNYSLVGNAYANAPPTSNPSLASDSTYKTISMQSIEQQHATDQIEEWKPRMSESPATQSRSQDATMTTGAQGTVVSNGNATMSGNSEISEKSEDQLLDLALQNGVGGIDLEADQRAFHKLLLGQADDFVHVLSLKGSLLYCSPAVTRILEYEPSELVGSTLSSLCHPSDVVPVMRQLKDASSVSNPIVKLLYRIRRKHSGYIWLEASGKLHIEPGKGRKCVIAVGRPRDVLKLNWNEVRLSGGLGDLEFWMRISERGMILNATLALHNVLGYMPQDFVGSTVYDVISPEYKQPIEVAIQQALLGAPATVQYKMKGRKGFVEVVTKFYPRHADAESSNDSTPLHIGIIAQTNEVGSEHRKNTSPFAQIAPVYASNSAGRSPTSTSESGSNASGSSRTPFQSTFKTLAHPSAISDNVFDELETRRPTSWQFELHQLQNINKKLRDEKEYLMTIRRKRGSVHSEGRSRKASSDAGSRASSNIGRSCQNCGRTDSPEWRSGPTGSKSLCNACGLRWAKVQKGGVPGGSPGSSTSGGSLSLSLTGNLQQTNLGSPLQSPSQAAFNNLSFSTNQSGTTPHFSPYTPKPDLDTAHWQQ
ncbi:uncharacterized protein JCM6883_000912 [Sporobolomyces salmoneus]|uniref:uncharacterized protein n=1 Tax=Sporobolomyces salmoneus TaxID=183962 RepID=UPI003181F230